MKLIQKMLLFLCIFFNSILPIEHNLTPENTIICSDLDEVLIKTSPWLIVNLMYGGIIYDPLNIWTYLTALYHAEKTYTKDADDNRNPLYDQYGNTINGLTFHLLFHGMRDKQLTPYVDVVLNIMENSRCFISGTRKIYQYLKEKKGYTIIFTTNNDHLAYAISAQSLGADLTDLADCTFVAQPGNNDEVIAQLQEFADQATTPKNYKDLLLEALTIQPTKNVLHAPGKKPDHEYYEYVIQNIGLDKNIIFIDDRKENVDGFDTLQSASSAQRIGIVFKDPQQLAQELVTVGILSETEGAALLEDIRYPGIWEKVKLFGKKLLSKLTPPATA